MKANVYFGRFGESFYCSICGYRLTSPHNGDLQHPAEKQGVFRRSPINCKFVGIVVRNPFRGMELALSTSEPRTGEAGK